MPRLNVAVGGPQGVGKSTVLRLLAAQRPDYDAMSVGDHFPPDFRSLPAPVRSRIRASASARLRSRLRENRDHVLIVDLHYLDLRETDPRVQRPCLLAQFDLHVLLIAPPELLLARRLSDSGRADRSTSIADAERDVSAHLEYVGRELDLAPGALEVVECRDTAEEVAQALHLKIAHRLQGSAPRS